MAEHLLLGDIAALLIVLGLTGPSSSRLRRRRWAGCARSATRSPRCSCGPPTSRSGTSPALHEAAVDHEAVHALQHALFVALGVNVWMPLFGPLPKPAWFGNLAKLGYIVAVRLLGAVLGNVLLWAGHPLYDVYDVSDPLADQTARRRDHDGRGLAAHARALRLALPPRGEGGRGAPGAARPGARGASS